MGQRLPPPHPSTPASWVWCLASLPMGMSPRDWTGHLLQGPVTFLCQSQPFLSRGTLPALPIFLYGPEGACTAGDTAQDPSLFLKALGLCHACLP